MDVFRLSPSPVSAATQKVADIKSTHSAVLKPMSGLEELESQGLFLYRCSPSLITKANLVTHTCCSLLSRE